MSEVRVLHRPPIKLGVSCIFEDRNLPEQRYREAVGKTPPPPLRTSGMRRHPSTGAGKRAPIVACVAYLSSLEIRVKDRPVEAIHRLVARRAAVGPQETMGDGIRILICGQLA